MMDATHGGPMNEYRVRVEYRDHGPRGSWVEEWEVTAPDVATAVARAIQLSAPSSWVTITGVTAEPAA